MAPHALSALRQYLIVQCARKSVVVCNVKNVLQGTWLMMVMVHVDLVTTLSQDVRGVIRI